MLGNIPNLSRLPSAKFAMLVALSLKNKDFFQLARSLQ
jgi:hypothetical protein